MYDYKLNRTNNIIPHNSQNVQVNLSKKAGQFANSYVIGNPEQQNLTKIQRESLNLYDLGLNVFPQPFGRKSGLPWRQLQYTRLHRTHKDYGLMMLFAGQCNIAVMCGRTSNNLFVIDCETPTSFDFQLEQLRRRDIPLWTVATKRGGHIYLFSSKGEVQNISTDKLGDVEIRGCRSYVLAPPSLHPSGEQYQWQHQQGHCPPSVDPQIIDWLIDNKGQAIQLESDTTSMTKAYSKPISLKYESPCKLAKDTKDFIQSGSRVDEGSRNHRLFKAACDLNGNGYSITETKQLLIYPAIQSGLSKHETYKTINSAYSQSRQPTIPSSQKDEEKPQWVYANEYAHTIKWEGRTAVNQRLLFQAFVTRSKLSSSDDGLFRASIRELAVLARMSNGTVQRLIPKLIDKQLIEKSTSDKASGATVWRFTKLSVQKRIESETDTLKESPLWKMHSVSILNLPDAIERGALGFNGVLVYKAMLKLSHGIFAKALTEKLELTLHQVKYAMKKLKEYGLIMRGSEGWVAIPKTDEELDKQVAEYVDIVGKRERRIERFKEQRQIFVGRKLYFARLYQGGMLFQQAIREFLMIRDQCVSRLSVFAQRLDTVRNNCKTFRDFLLAIRSLLKRLEIESWNEVQFYFRFFRRFWVTKANQAIFS